MANPAPLSAVKVTNLLLDELEGRPAGHAPTMGRLGKVRYTHAAMADAIIENPAISQNDLAAMFGFTAGWVSNVMASDAFQAHLAQRKDELVDPVLRLTIEERFKALVARSLEVLQEKLARPVAMIPDNLALQAAALGARSLGLGRDNTPPAAPQGDRLTILADRLIVLQRDVVRKVHNGEIIEGVSEAVHDTPGGEEGERSQSDARLPVETAIRADNGVSSESA